MNRVLLVAVLSWLVAPGACAHRSPLPADALVAFGAAVEKKDYPRAYGLMSASYRQRVSLADFRRLAEEGGADYATGARNLRENGTTLGGRVEVPLGSDDRVPLVRERDGWHLDGQPFNPFDQGTPRAALRTFIRAAETRRYDQLLSLVPARFRAVVTVEKLRAFWEGAEAAANKALLRDLRLHVSGRITEDGDEAYMAYGVNRQMRFVREDGLWRIESPE